MAVLTAIGATSGRLLRQHLTENAVLALAGALLGILLAHWGLSAIRQDVLRINLPRLHELQLAGVTWLFALGMTAVSAIALGAVPASLSIRQVQSGDLNADLRRAAARQGTLATTRQTTM